MNNKIYNIIFLAILFLVSLDLLACDACGCSSGGNFVGLLPQFHKKFVGLRYKSSYFNVDPTKFHGLADHSDQLPHKDTYSVTELWARFYPAKRLQLLAFLPYGVNTKTEGGVTDEIKGVGDMSAILSTIIFNTTDSLEHNFRHALLVGAGVKLPTGKYQQRDTSKVLYAPAFQIGTGAYSFLLNVIYTVRYKNFGLNSNVTYSYNGKAENDYRFGSNFSAANSLFYWIKLNNVSVIPNTGIFFQDFAKDVQYSTYQALTGGRHLYGILGCEVYFSRFALGITYQAPMVKQSPIETPISDGKMVASISVVF